MKLRLHGQPIIDEDAGRARIAPPAPEDRLGPICVQEVVVRGSASAQTVWPRVQVVEREDFHCFGEGGAQADGASELDQVHGLHTIARVEEAVDRWVVNGDDLLRSVPGATFCPRKGDCTGAAAAR